MEMKSCQSLTNVLLSIIIVSSFIYFVKANSDYEDIVKELLQKEVYKYYSPTDTDNNVHVAIDFSVLSIKPHGKCDDGFCFMGHLVLVWSDKRISWNNSEDWTDKKISWPVEKIWTPDLKINHRFLGKQSIIHSIADEKVLIRNNGDVLWSLRLPLSSYCSLNVKNWLRNIHICTIEIQPTESLNEMMVLTAIGPTHYIQRVKDGHWKRLNISIINARNHRSKKNDHSVLIRMTFEKMHSNHHPLVMFSMVIFNVLTLIPYTLPPELASQKIALPLFLIFTFCLYCQFLYQYLPKHNRDVYNDLWAMTMISLNVFTEFMQCITIKLWYMPVNAKSSYKKTIFQRVSTALKRVCSLCFSHRHRSVWRIQHPRQIHEKTIFFNRRYGGSSLPNQIQKTVPIVSGLSPPKLLKWTPAVCHVSVTNQQQNSEGDLRPSLSKKRRQRAARLNDRIGGAIVIIGIVIMSIFELLLHFGLI